MAEVLLIEMPVEKLGQQTSPESETRNRWPGQIPQAAETKTRLKRETAVCERLVFTSLWTARQSSAGILGSHINSNHRGELSMVG
jgi:hypothetical protein